MANDSPLTQRTLEGFQVAEGVAEDLEEDVVALEGSAEGGDEKWDGFFADSKELA